MIQEWIDEVMTTGGSIPFKTAYLFYSAFCENRDNSKESPRAFLRYLKGSGWTVKRINIVVHSIYVISNLQPTSVAYSEYKRCLAAQGYDVELYENEWEVPVEADPAWSDQIKAYHKAFWDLKRERQREMDASTARRAKSEILYDQPHEDKKRVRVTGPFTVESLSPHIVLDGSDAERAAPKSVSAESVQDYHKHILEHLKTTGVQSRLKEDRIKFDWLEELPGEWLHAEGIWKDKNEKIQNIAISIGPQYGTVGKQWIEEAAKKAVSKIPKYDLLIVAGFAFEGYTANENMHIGRLPILPVKISPELLVRELKNTGEGNLFMVFGEPDVKIVENKDDTLSVKLLGVDVYDPVKGLLRSDTPEDIACWFIDTAYNGEVFFVRHAYFMGEGEPYKQLKKALNSEINEEAWEALYRTESLPFAKPEAGKIAVKVINHHGNEITQVFFV